MGTLSIHQVAVGGFDQNLSYLIVDESKKQACLIDPCGMIDRVLLLLNTLGLELASVAITHTHADHIDRLPDLAHAMSVPVYVGETGVDALALPSGRAVPLSHDSSFQIGEATVRVLHTPGHTDDSVCFFVSEDQASDGIPKLITGDTLFIGGCGRTNREQVSELFDSLQLIKTLPDDTRLYPGHDYGARPISTLKREKKSNKYLRARSLEAFCALRLPMRSDGRV